MSTVFHSVAINQSGIKVILYNGLIDESDRFDVVLKIELITTHCL
jgi:hypothetical protein